MVSSNMIRVGAILALLLGSIYVLLPTILQEDLESRLARQASSVEAPSGRSTAEMKVVLDVQSGDPEALADALGARLNAAGVPVARVAASGQTVEVYLSAGASADQVRELATLSGEAALVDPRDLAPEGEAAEAGALPAELTEVLQAAGLNPADWAHLSAVAGEQISAETVPTEVTDVSRVDGTVQVVRPALPEGWPFALVTVDGAVRGALVPTDGAFRWAPLGEPRPELIALLPGPLGGSLVPQAVAQQEEAAPSAAQTVEQLEPSGVPDWVLALLPNTRMNLGLDLQGGLDLTLQVGQDEAVLAQVARDLAYARDQAEREGLVLDSARRERSLPVVWFETRAPLSDVQAFVRKAMPDYIYSASEGNRHAFELSAERQEEIKDQAVEQVLDTLRKRVDATGVKEPSIVKKGRGQINVQLPGEVDLQSAVDALGTTAVLEFRLVDPDFDPSLLERIILAAQEQMPPDQFADDHLLNEWLWDTGRLDPDRLILWEYEEDEDGTLHRLAPLPLYNDALLTGNDVSHAGVGWDQNQQPFVSLDFKPRGGRVFCDVTAEWVGKRFAIILDDMVQSAPSIRERICGGSARIDMGSAMDPLKEAQTLALVLRTGSLDAPVDLGGVRQVGASLGQDAIRTGALAALVGGIIVVVFMAVWYKKAGLMANVALVVNVLMMLAALALFGATLTLPGIAGIALTVGMAVDANIIIFERIREELKLGVNPRKAVDVGFDKALSAILDANITTAIAGIVLFSYGTGPIKGFAVTLLIGIVTTLITALFVTRTLMDLSTRASSARLSI